jgi:hypothetical protein
MRLPTEAMREVELVVSPKKRYSLAAFVCQEHTYIPTA